MHLFYNYIYDILSLGPTGIPIFPRRKRVHERHDHDNRHEHSDDQKSAPEIMDYPKSYVNPNLDINATISPAEPSHSPVLSSLGAYSSGVISPSAARERLKAKKGATPPRTPATALTSTLLDEPSASELYNRRFLGGSSEDKKSAPPHPLGGFGYSFEQVKKRDYGLYSRHSLRTRKNATGSANTQKQRSRSVERKNACPDSLVGMAPGEELPNGVLHLEREEIRPETTSEHIQKATEMVLISMGVDPYSSREDGFWGFFVAVAGFISAIIMIITKGTNDAQ